MFEIKDDQIKELEKDLKAFANKAVPFATKNTLNGAAFATQKTYRRLVSNKMVERNKFTKSSIQVDQARGLNIRSQEAVVGSTADYMESQEFGDTVIKDGKKGVPIATSYSAGQSEGSRPRRKLPRKPNKLANIRLKKSNRKKPKNNKQALLFKVQDAVKTGRRIFYHDFGGRKKEGIFKVVGGRKSFKKGWPIGAKLKMLYDLSKVSVNIPKNPTLGPSVIATEKKIPKIYKKSLEFQLKRHGLFK